MFSALTFHFGIHLAALEFPEIKDIAAPVEPPPVPVAPWIWWLAAGVLGMALLIGLFLWMRAVGRRMRIPGLPPSPEQMAVGALETLRQAAPGLAADEFALKLSGIVRTFLHRQTGVLAHFETSPEILGDRRSQHTPPPIPAIGAFRQVLTDSDALKYGPAVADRKVQTDALIDAALSAVRAAH